MIARLLASALLAINLSATSVFAWGEAGHSIVCEIAFQELNDKAKAEVIRLIRTDRRYRYFYDSCNWPDSPRKRGSEHFSNLERDALRVDFDDPCGRANRCVITAILKDVNDLALGATDTNRLQALKFLGHWVGDIHQPLHVSFADDRGGNSIKENGPCRGALHSVWDTCIIEEALGLDPLEIATDLHGSVTAAQRAAWTADIENLDVEIVGEWANESFALAREPEVEYCVQRDGGCWYSHDVDHLNAHDEMKTVRVDGAYISRHRDTVAKRLTMAGVRLGALINAVIGSD